jgi:hypothetical protein
MRNIQWLLTLLGVLVHVSLALAEPRSAEPLAVEYRPPGGEPLSLYRQSHAEVIGIDRYDHLGSLGGATRDAKQVAEQLRQSGFQVTTLLDKQATREALTQLIGDELPARLRPDDRVLVYFAGHGLSKGEGEAAMGNLMPVDARREAPASSAISMAELQRWFAQYPARHVLFVADACYSGLAIGTRATGLPPQTKDYLREVTRRPVRVAMVAGTSGQEAHEYRGNGLFTWFWLQGLRGAADANRDGLVTTDELAAYVKPAVAQVAAYEFHAQQHPQVGRSGEGEFVFVLPAPGAEATPTSPASARVTLPQPRGVQGITPEPGQLVLVLPPTYIGSRPELQVLPGAVAELVATRLKEAPGAAVVEPAGVARALLATGPQLGMRVTLAQIPVLAEQFSAQWIVQTQVVEVLGLVRLQLQCLSADGRPVGAPVTVAQTLDEIPDLAARAAAALQPRLGLTAAVSTAKRPPVKRAAVLLYGEALAARAAGDEASARAKLAAANRADPGISAAVPQAKPLAAQSK